MFWMRMRRKQLHTLSSPPVCAVWHVGCCDSSPSQHASKHAVATGHPIITSFEPGEDWFFDYEKQGIGYC